MDVLYESLNNNDIKSFEYYKWVEKTQKYFLQDLYQKFIKEGFPLFKLIEIETINRCNGKCSFCPVNSDIDPREYHYMSDELFIKIINDLCDIGYNETISIYSNNESFLDPKIIERLEYAKNKLPTAYHMLYTNGSLLTKEKYEHIVKLLDFIIINNYTDDLHIHDHLKWINDKDLNEGTCQTLFYIRKQNKILTNRGGVSPNYNNLSNDWTHICQYPFYQMIVRPDGKLSGCCNDPLGEFTLGDLNQQSILEAWYGEDHNNFKKNMILNGKQGYEKCTKCNIITSKFFQKEYYDDLINIIKSNKKSLILCEEYDFKYIKKLLITNGIKEYNLCSNMIDIDKYINDYFIISTVGRSYDFFKYDPTTELCGHKYIVFIHKHSVSSITNYV